ncbi:hypothetical protein ACWCPX_29585 [Streptomyces olivaceoviridis]
MAEVPDELIKLERSAEEERAKLAGLTGDDYDAQWRRWREASERCRRPSRCTPRRRASAGTNWSRL